MSALLSWGEAIRMRTHFEDAAMKRAQGIVDIILTEKLNTFLNDRSWHVDSLEYEEVSSGDVIAIWVSEYSCGESSNDVIRIPLDLFTTPDLNALMTWLRRMHGEEVLAQAKKKAERERLEAARIAKLREDHDRQEYARLKAKYEPRQSD